MVVERKIPAGYKMTEVGVVPEDWEVSNLKSICDSIVDGTHYTPKYVNDGIPFYSVENVTSDDFSNTKYISLKEHKKLIKRCLPKKGDILLTRIGTLGKTKFIDWDVDASIYVSLALLKINNKIYNKFLYSFTQSSAFINEVKKRALINAIPQKINMGDIGEVIVLEPPLSEQKAISRVLSDIDNLIASIETLIVKKQKIKQGAMQELLTGKRRLPGFGGEWEKKQLGDIADIRTGKSNNEDKSDNGQYPFFVRSKKVERINTYSYDGEAILIPGEGGIGDIYHYINGKFDYHQRVYKISDVKDVNCKYLYYYLMQNFCKQAAVNTVKATVDSLRLPTFQQFELHFPVFKVEQQAIAQVLTDMDDEIDTLEEKLDKYKNIKQGMMQELLTGRIRLI